VDYLEGIQKNFDEAAKVLKFNCEKYGHGDSCYKLGAYYVTGKGELRGFSGMGDCGAQSTHRGSAGR
jgi:TPR repeat protein